MQIAEHGIKFYDYIHLLKKRWWIIVLLTLIFASLMGYRTYSSYVPVYQTSTTFLMHYKNTDSMTSSRDYSVGSNVILNFTGMLKSESLRSEIREALDSQDLGSISISEGDGSIIRLSVSHSDSQMAVEVANVTAEVLMKMVKRMMSDINLSVLDEAQSAYITSGMALNRSILIGAMIGVVLSIGIILLLEVLDTTFKTPGEIEAELNLPIMGVIPDTEVELTKYRMNKAKGTK